MRRQSGFGLAALGTGVVIVLGMVAGAAMADLATWDQERVTSIATTLAKACDGWEQALRDQPGLEEMGSGDAGQGFGLVQKAQVLREQSEGLAGSLKKGAGHDKTLDMYRSLKEVVDDTEVEAQEAELDKPTLAMWAKVADAVRQIAPYYDPKADADPTLKSGS